MDISGAESRTTDKTYQGLGEAGMEDVSTAGQGTTSDSRLDLDQIDTSPIHTRANAGPSVGTGIGSGEFGTPGPAGADFAGGGQDTTPAGAGSRRGVGVYEDTPVPSVAGEDGTYTGVAQGTGQPTLTEDTAFPRSDPGEGTAYHGVAENEEA
jgi:hypothetical protein